jgi:hypothetical protein
MRSRSPHRKKKHSKPNCKSTQCLRMGLKKILILKKDKKKEIKRMRSKIDLKKITRHL